MRVLEAYPEQHRAAVEALIDIASLHLVDKNFAAAHEALDRALRDCGDQRLYCSRTLLWKGWAYAYEGKFEQCHAACQRVLKEFPEQRQSGASALQESGYAYIQEGRTEEAFASFERVQTEYFAQTRDCSRALMLQSMLRRRAGRFDEARALAGRAVERYPKEGDQCAGALLEMGHCYRDEQRWAEGAACYARIIREWPSSLYAGFAAMWQGLLAMKAGRREDAHASWEQALQLGPPEISFDEFVQCLRAAPGQWPLNEQGVRMTPQYLLRYTNPSRGSTDFSDMIAFRAEMESGWLPE